MAAAIDGFFRRLVDSALNPLLELLSATLLTTPEPLDLPRVAQLWDSSWQLVTASYALVIMAAGVLLMMYETLQNRWGLTQLLPRIVAGFIAGAMSMLVATYAVRLANAMAGAVAGDGVDPDSATATLRELVTTNTTGGPVFALLLSTALVVLIAVLLVTYVVRVSVTIVLIVAAPLALMCHGLPMLEPIARWWWRAFGACLAIQVVQSLTLVTAARVLLSPDGFPAFGTPDRDGLVDLIVALALVGMLVKIPFWLLSACKINPTRSLPATVVRSYLAYKTLSLLKGTNTSTRHHTPATHHLAPARRHSPRIPAAAADPYTRARPGRDGQMMLPLEGVRRIPRHTLASTSAPEITTSTRTPAAGRGRQLQFDFREPDPYKGVRPLRGGQYPLPIEVRRVPPVPARPSTAPAVSPASTRAQVGGGRQLAFEFTPPDPYARIRPGRGGQYPLPIETRRTPAPPPPPPPPPTAGPPPPRRPVRQLHLPLPDLPLRRRKPRKK
ncbi:hypothetical protein [Nocardia vulneris]|uniref:hypothetical protein n=1 Tax=Nocardia vulneris TaxID=1141657 RepID=UPI0012E04151|nr:hypothetical protein [Nocardia vulneris]